MPIAVRSAAGRNRWFDDYATTSLERDVTAITSLRRGAELPKLFTRLAAQTGQVLNISATAYPKIHIVDSGLAARLLRISPARLARLDLSALAEFGHLLETFVVGELLKQASWSDNATAVGHWRTHDGQEVDLVVERDDGVVTGFEVKAGRDVQRKDASGLIALRDSLGGQFNAGVVLTTGDTAYRLDDRI